MLRPGFLSEAEIPKPRNFGMLPPNLGPSIPFFNFSFPNTDPRRTPRRKCPGCR